MGNSRFLYFICAICIIIATVSITMLVQQQQKPITTQNTRPKIEYASEEEKEELLSELSSLSLNLPSPKISSTLNDFDSYRTRSDIGSDNSNISSRIHSIKMKLMSQTSTHRVTKKEFKEMKDEVKEIKQDIRYLKLRVDQYNSTH